jgi:chemotaxis signal transduction protein
MNNNYEESKLLASWICGFNQIRGEVFTILDFNKTIEYLLNRKDDKKYRKLSIDNRIVYAKR